MSDYQNKYSYTLGHFAVKGDQGELIVNIPFRPQGKFICFRVKEKKGEGSPDWIIRLNRCNVGSMWKRVSEKNNTDYLSGNLFFPDYPGSIFYFNVFAREEEDGKKSFVVVHTPPDTAGQTVAGNTGAAANHPEPYPEESTL